MAEWYRKSATRWTLTAALGVFAGLGFWWWTLPPSGPVAGAAQTKSDASGRGTAPAEGSVAWNPAAVRYAAAFQQDAWDDIVTMTCWMQQRLVRVQIETGSTAARDEARARLRERISDRRVEGNLLRPEGVEDQYVFVSGATVEPIGFDPGRTGLEQPTKDRTWMRVTYPSRRGALRDDKGIPIRSITVGVDVSTEGLALKANVIGNLDIDWESISYDWNTRSDSSAK